jgi:sugar lactone lactonase YvrE
MKDASAGKMVKVDLETKMVSEVENSDPSHYYSGAMAMAFNPIKPNLLYYTYGNSVYSLDVSNSAAAPVLVINTGLSNPIHGICFDPKGNAYIANRNGTHAIWMITSDGALIKVIGNGEGNVDGPQATAKMTYPSAIAINSNGCLYINHYGSTVSSRIRKYTPHVPSEE